MLQIKLKKTADKESWVGESLCQGDTLGIQKGATLTNGLKMTFKVISKNLGG